MLLPPFARKEARLIEKNLQNALLAMSYVHKKQGDFQYIFSKIPHPIFNCVIDVHATDLTVKETIQTVTADYEKNNISHGWWLSERSTPMDLGQHLLRAGFQLGPQYQGMHANLKKIHLDLKHGSPISIKRISHISDLDHWITPIQEGFAFSNLVATAFLETFKDLFVRDSRLIHYLAFYDNQLAGSLTLFLDEDSAGLYNGAVLPPFRNKSVMKSLVYCIFQDIKNEGLEDIVVQVNEASHPMASQAGFKEYLNFQSYLSPETMSLS